MQRNLISGNIGGVTVGDYQPVRIMGVINLTRNSFYSGSVASSEEQIVKAASRMTREGANLIDVGARSTAPYRRYEISLESEKRLIARALKLLRKSVDIPLSVDTTRFEVAKTGLHFGASIVNDVYGFTQKNSARLAGLIASKEVSLLTSAHERVWKKGSPKTRVSSCLEWTLDFAQKNGIDLNQITIDPGIGFFSDPKVSNVEWNCSIISNLEDLRKFKRPICVGISRKRFIGKILGKEFPEDRLIGSLSATAVAVYKGTHLLRTHDVAPTLEVVKVASELRQKRFNPEKCEK